MNQNTSDPLEVVIIHALEGLRQIQPRDPQKAARGREQFLIRADVATRAAQPDRVDPLSEQPITTSSVKRLKGWFEQITQPPLKKERFAMFPTLATILVSLALLFGGAGATVFAAQDSLPDDALYPVKTWSEDLRLELAAEPSAQIELALNFANRRMEEMSGLTAQGSNVPAGVADRWQRQVEFALALAAGQSGADLEPLLLRIREQLRIQDQLLTRMRLHNPEEATPLMAQLQTRLRERLQLVEAGLEAPSGFQYHDRHGPGGRPNDPPEGGYDPGPGAGDGPADGSGEQYGPGPGDGPEDGTGEQYGPGSGDGLEDGTGEQYGPGPGECTQDCEGEQYGPGPSAGDSPEDGTGEQYGPGPGKGDAPEDGTGEQNGPGPGPGDCTGGCDQEGGGQNSSGEQGGPDKSGGNGGGNGSKP